MGKKLVSNSDIMNLFGIINQIKSNSELNETQKQKQIKQLQDNMIADLSFLVYGQTKQYHFFPNYEDLVQEGFIGLMTAVYKFDCTINTNFFAYAEQWIRHSVKRAASKFDIVYNPNKIRVVYSEPDEDEVDIEKNLEDIYFIKERIDKIEKILNDFPEKEREIVCKIFGLFGHQPQTLREIGPQFDLTYERIRQIKNNVIDKLKQHQQLIEMNGI